MSDSLYDLYQEKVGVNLKNMDNVCEEVVASCKLLIKRGIPLPYQLSIKNIHQGDTSLLNPILRNRYGIVATHNKPYTEKGSLKIDITVSNFVKLEEEIDPIVQANINHKRWWEWK